jgi:hypothetical protein
MGDVVCASATPGVKNRIAASGMAEFAFRAEFLLKVIVPVTVAALE